MDTNRFRAVFSTPVFKLSGEGVVSLRLLLTSAGNIQSLLSHTVTGSWHSQPPRNRQQSAVNTAE